MHATVQPSPVSNNGSFLQVIRPKPWAMGVPEWWAALAVLAVGLLWRASVAGTVSGAVMVMTYGGRFPLTPDTARLSSGEFLTEILFLFALAVGFWLVYRKSPYTKNDSHWGLLLAFALVAISYSLPVANAKRILAERHTDAERTYDEAKANGGIYTPPN